MRGIYTNSIGSLKSMHQSPKVTGIGRNCWQYFVVIYRKSYLGFSYYMYKKGTYAHANIKIMILNLKLVHTRLHTPPGGFREQKCVYSLFSVVDPGFEGGGGRGGEGGQRIV